MFEQFEIDRAELAGLPLRLPAPRHIRVLGPVVGVSADPDGPIVVQVLDGPGALVELVDIDAASAPHSWHVGDVVAVAASTPEPVDLLDLPRDHGADLPLIVRTSDAIRIV